MVAWATRRFHLLRMYADWPRLQRDSELRPAANHAVLNHLRGQHSQVAKAAVCKVDRAGGGWIPICPPQDPEVGFNHERPNLISVAEVGPSLPHEVTPTAARTE